jgi:hypothetical protein
LLAQPWTSRRELARRRVPTPEWFLYDLPSVLIAIDTSLSPNRYSADPITYINMLHALGIVPQSLERQVFDTAFGLKVLRGD